MNERQKRFAEEYVIDLNAKQAAIRAGYSAKSAEVQGCELLKLPEVKLAIQETMNRRAEKTGLTAERVLQEIQRLAFYDPAEFVDPFGEPIRGPQDLHHLPEDVRRAIIGWSWDKEGRFVLKLADKTKGLELLGKHLKLFTEKVEHSGSLTLEELIAGARES